MWSASSSSRSSSTLTRRLDLPPRAYLIALATASNVGGVATLTGNPQNMLIGSFSGLS